MACDKNLLEHVKTVQEGTSHEHVNVMAACGKARQNMIRLLKRPTSLYRFLAARVNLAWFSMKNMESEAAVCVRTGFIDVRSIRSKYLKRMFLQAIFKNELHFLYL